MADKITARELFLVLESDFASIEHVVNQTESFLQERITDEELAYRVVLLATEAVTNAIEHGNQFDAEKQVFVRLTIEETELVLIVEDQGAGFDPDATADPRDSANLLREGGRGLFFMEQMADEVQFEDGGRKLILTFRTA